MEEKLVSECLEALIGIACGVSKEIPELSQNIEYEVIRAQEDWKHLIDSEIQFIKSNEETPQLIFLEHLTQFMKDISRSRTLQKK